MGRAMNTTKIATKQKMNTKEVQNEEGNKKEPKMKLECLLGWGTTKSFIPSLPFLHFNEQLASFLFLLPVAEEREESSKIRAISFINEQSLNFESSRR